MIGQITAACVQNRRNSRACNIRHICSVKHLFLIRAYQLPEKAMYLGYLSSNRLTEYWNAKSVSNRSRLLTR